MLVTIEIYFSQRYFLPGFSVATTSLLLSWVVLVVLSGSIRCPGCWLSLKYILVKDMRLIPCFSLATTALLLSWVGLVLNGDVIIYLVSEGCW